MDNHHPKTLMPFPFYCAGCPEIPRLSFRPSGDCDYLQRSLTRDLDSYDELLSKKLFAGERVARQYDVFNDGNLKYEGIPFK